MIPSARWPRRLWLVRHGESAGNVAVREAAAAGLAHVDIAKRDADIPLSQLGRRQSQALGRWFAELDPAERPEVILSSPYIRARQTADLIHAANGVQSAECRCVTDERVREREFGILDRLTKLGVEQLYPQQAEFKRLLGKFYHRPPGGESWCDVILRLRSALDTLSLHYASRRVLIVTHEVVVMCFRYLLEELDEERIMQIDAQGDIANCGVTEYAFDPAPEASGGKLVLVRFNVVGPLEQQGTPVTTERDVPVAAR